MEIASSLRSSQRRGGGRVFRSLPNTQPTPIRVRGSQCQEQPGTIDDGGRARSIVRRPARPARRSPRSHGDATTANSCVTSTSNLSTRRRSKSSGKIDRDAIAAARRANAPPRATLPRKSARARNCGGSHSTGCQTRGLNTPDRPATRNPPTTTTRPPMSPCGYAPTRFSYARALSVSRLPRIQRTSHPAVTAGASISGNGASHSQSPSRIRTPGGRAAQARRMGRNSGAGRQRTRWDARS